MGGHGPGRRPEAGARTLSGTPDPTAAAGGGGVDGRGPPPHRAGRPRRPGHPPALRLLGAGRAGRGRRGGEPGPGPAPRPSGGRLGGRGRRHLGPRCPPDRPGRLERARAPAVGGGPGRVGGLAVGRTRLVVPGHGLAAPGWCAPSGRRRPRGRPVGLARRRLGGAGGPGPGRPRAGGGPPGAGTRLDPPRPGSGPPVGARRSAGGGPGPVAGPSTWPVASGRPGCRWPCCPTDWAAVPPGRVRDGGHPGRRLGPGRAAVGRRGARRPRRGLPGGAVAHLVGRRRRGRAGPARRRTGGAGLAVPAAGGDRGSAAGDHRPGPGAPRLAGRRGGRPHRRRSAHRTVFRAAGHRRPRRARPARRPGGVRAQPDRAHPGAGLSQLRRAGPLHPVRRCRGPGRGRGRPGLRALRRGAAGGVRGVRLDQAQVAAHRGDPGHRGAGRPARPPRRSS